MKPFRTYLDTNDVRKASPDPGLATSLRKDAEQRIAFVLSLSIDDKNATILFEQVYEALRQCIDSLLTLEGYKSYSHAASIAFLEHYPLFTPEELHALDNAREKRNLAKYYAKQLHPNETQELLSFCQHLKKKLDEQHEQLLKKKS